MTAKKAPAKKRTVKAKATKPTPTKTKAAPGPNTTRRVVLTDLTASHDNEALPGHFVDVVSGPHKGRYGVIMESTFKDAPVVIRTRDDENERLSVDYDDLRPASSGKR